jgi:hypothetical protein
MNTERGWRIPKSKQTEEYLTEAAWEFANKLAAGRWGYRSINQVAITRIVSEELGVEVMRTNQDVLPIFTTIELSFRAIKQYIENESGRGSINVPSYTITSTVSQQIDKAEIPKHVLNEMFEDAEEEEAPFYDLIDMHGAEDEGAEWIADNLDEFDLTRSQEVEYDINHDGSLEDYSVRYLYLFDDTVVHTVDYTESSNEVLFVPVQTGSGKVYERRPLVVRNVSEERIPAEIEGIDSEFEKFLMERSLRELTEFTAQPREEHIRRILAMIGLLGSGLVK